MTIQVLRDPRPYLLAVMAVALLLIVPLMFAFVTLMDSPFGSGTGSIVLWVLLGVAVAGLLGGLMVILGRATRLAELEHKPPDGDEHRAP